MSEVSPGLTRRRLMQLWLLITGLCSLGATSGAWRSIAAGDCSSPSPDSLAERLAALARPRSAARRLGQAYLEAAAHEARVEILIEKLGGRAELSALCGDDLRRALRARHRRDLDAQQVACVEGWILSPTEARLYGLASLLP